MIKARQLKIHSVFGSFVMILLFTAQANVYAQQDNSKSFNNADNSEIKVHRKRKGIDAELVDAGDYYMHPDGRTIRMLRKKDVYVIDSVDSARALQRVKSQYEERVKDVTGHRLGNHKVIKLDNSETVKSRRKEQFDVSAAMIKSADGSIRNLKSVFANERGEGDILLMPKITVKFDSDVEPKLALNRMDRRYGLTVDRKLRVSGNVYSMSLKTQISESQQFALVRSVMNDAMVDWAEPQFIAKAQKTTFEPDDTFFNQQWHLRNTGQQVARCDADCDANNAWDINIGSNSGSGGNGNSPSVTGDGMVIAIIDDGVQLDHEDLNIWQNPGEGASNNGVDNDNNGYVDDWQGWDFVIDSSTNNRLQNANLDGSGTCTDGVDSLAGEDNDPSPQATSDCVTIEGDAVENDDHGTSVAGLAAAAGDNATGVTGVAYNAEILPIRLISQFDTDPAESNSSTFCIRAAEAMEYAGRYADVVNNSWTFDGPCTALDTAISNVTSGNVMYGGNNVSKRTNGSPVLFASGNQASGWVKVSVPVTAGEHAYEWRFLRDGLFPSSNVDDSAWLDDITWPSESSVSVDFESGSFASNGFSIGNINASNTCIDGCAGFLVGSPAWSIETTPEVILSGSNAAKINATGAECSNTYLYAYREESAAGILSFWVWVDADTLNDKFEFLIDGKEILSIGDFASEVINGEVAYPARESTNINGLIAVGSSNSGDLSGLNTASLSSESRAFYSQYGPSLDVVAPSSNQQLGIVTTDREGADGYNDGSESIGDDNYTNTFGGTSASTPIVAGIAAAMLAVDTNLSADSVKTILRTTADKIGNEAYSAGRNDFYGYGRVNMYAALLDAGNITNGVNYSDSCDSSGEKFSFTSAHIIFQPQPIFFCPAIGDVPQDDEMCFPIKAVNSKVAVICL